MAYSDFSVATNKLTLDKPAVFPNIAAGVDRVNRVQLERCALLPLRAGLAKKVMDKVAGSGQKGY